MDSFQLSKKMKLDNFAHQYSAYWSLLWLTIAKTPIRNEAKKTGKGVDIILAIVQVQEELGIEEQGKALERTVR